MSGDHFDLGHNKRKISIFAAAVLAIALLTYIVGASNNPVYRPAQIITSPNSAFSLYTPRRITYSTRIYSAGKERSRWARSDTRLYVGYDIKHSNSSLSRVGWGTRIDAYIFTGSYSHRSNCEPKRNRREEDIFRRWRRSEVKSKPCSWWIFRLMVTSLIFSVQRLYSRPWYG